MKKYWKQIFGFALAVLLLAGCSSKSVSYESNGAPMEQSSKVELGYGALYDTVTDGSLAMNPEKPSANTQIPSAQKLIRTMTLEVETDDMDTLLANLEARIQALGGYLEERNVRNGSYSSTRRYRYANLVIRVPADRLDEMAEHISGASNVVNHQESAEDITLSYVATQSRITALEVEQTRLLELLAKADNMSDLLQIEARLTEVRTELEQVTSQLRLYDNLVDYGTVHLSITEVQVFTVVEQETLWQRIGNGLRDNCKALWEGAQEVFVFLVTSLPFLILLAAAGVVILVAVKNIRRKTGKKSAKEAPPKETEE